MLTAVTGINWGDEGKGRVIDLLAEHADVVARYQGGNNADHTFEFPLAIFDCGVIILASRECVKSILHMITIRN